MAANDGSVFEERESRYDGKHDYFFNESGHFKDEYGNRVEHGHVVEGRDSTPEQTTYDYVRDVDGNEYINRR
jgi:hypothetical protein